MSLLLLAWALNLAQVMLGLSMICATYRVAFGPRAQDRVLGLDSLYVNAMLMLLVFGILIIVTICVTIVSTYFLLNAEVRP